MKRIIYSLIISMFVGVFANSQCNTNTSICTSGTAGPFNFIPASTQVSSCLDFWNGVSAPTYAYIILHITSSGPLNMLIDANTSFGFVDVAVFNIPAGQSPCTAIQNSANEIGCNYASASSGCNQFGTYFGCTSSVPAPNVVAGQELMIVVEDWSNAQNSFTLQLGPPPGAQTGPPNPAITAVGPFCTTSPAVQLIAADMGGTWSGPGTSSSGMFNPATAGLGTHTITYNVGQAPCNASSTTSITVSPAPVAGTASTTSTSYCGTSNVPLTLTGSAGTIQWQSAPNSTGPWTNISGATTANYTVNGVSTNTCFRAVVSGCGSPVNSNTVCVTINQSASGNANVDQIICAGGTVNLAGSIGGGASGANWSAPSGSFSNPSNLNCTYTPSVTSGTVTLTLTTDDPAGPCASAADQMVITVNPPAMANANIDQSICAGGTVTLAGSVGGGAGSAVWSAPSGTFSNSSSLTSSYSPSISSGTVILTLTTNDPAGPCASANDQLIITVNTNTPVNAGPDQTVCAGTSVNLSGTNATTYSWSNGISNGVAFVPAATTTYTVTGTTGGSCISSDQVTVTVNPIPVINAGSDVAVCTGNSANLMANGAASYTWSPGTGLNTTNGASVIASPSATTTYTVSGTSLGCSSTDVITVTVNSNANINAGPDVNICTGGSSMLSASNGVSYTWNNGLGVGNNVSVSPLSTTTYSVTGTDAQGCTGTDAITITVNSNPAVNAGADQTVCNGTSVTLTGAGAATYSWSGGISNGVSFTPSSTTTYTVNGTAASGCSASDQVTITVNPIPVINAGSDVAVCTGNSTNLMANGATSYTWSPGTGLNTTNGASVIATPSATTTYTVSGTSLGCSSTDVITVTVNTSANINAGPDVNICTGGSSMLSASNGVSYTWNNGLGVGNNVTVSPLSTTTYSVTGTDAQGCVGTDAITITVNSNPAVNAGADQTICTGTSIALTASGAATYSWSSGISNGVSFVPANTTTYTVNGTAASGCTASDQVTVTVNPLPIVNGGADQTICNGTSLTLNGTGALNYSWTGGVSNGIAFSPSSTATYTLTGTAATGCSATDLVTVTVNPIPTINAGTDVDICTGNSSNLMASGATSYTWSPGTGLNTTNGASVVANPSSTTTYTVTGTSLGCSSSDVVTVTVNTIANIDAGPDAVICAGGSSMLSASNGVTYTWDNGLGVGNNVAVSPITTTTYSVTGTNAQGCTGTDAIIITVNALPVINAGPDQAVCEGTDVTLSASGGSVYTWDNSVTDGVPFTPANTQTYTVTGTSAAGCISTDQVLVAVNPIPLVNAGNNIPLCAGQTVTLTGSGANTYTWDNGVVNGVPFFPIVGSVTYTVTGTTTAGCTDTDDVTVIVSPLPLINFSPDTTIGCAPLTVNFINTTVGAADCIWTMSDGSTFSGCGSVTNTFELPGCYDISLSTTDGNGCSNSVTALNLICVEANPEASFVPSTGAVTEFDPIVDFNNTSTGASDYLWSFGDMSVTSTETDPSHNYLGNDIGEYVITLIASSPFGCLDTAYAFIQFQEELVFYVPNTFTPDGDKFNPVFQPVFTAGFDPMDYTLYIFNRWGELIFESHNAEIGWDGTYGSNGEIAMCQDGFYTWKIEFKVTRNDERKMATGHVNLLR